MVNRLATTVRTQTGTPVFVFPIAGVTSILVGQGRRVGTKALRRLATNAVGAASG